MRFQTLNDWLAWQQVLHPRDMELGLQRVSEVARRLQLTAPAHSIITVAGTNGKGSTVAMLESILCAAGYRVGSFSSPHLLRYNERVRLQSEPVEDRLLCEAFARIDAARGDVSLSYFEFGALAAILIFAQQGVDAAVLEVGLGGRLDAVNLLNADVAAITGVAIDHTEWLGMDREAIGREKAGIMRPGKPAVCGDPDPPASVVNHARECGAPLYRLGPEHRFEVRGDVWDWVSPLREWRDLPFPALSGEVQLRNAAVALMSLALLKDRLPVDADAIRRGLRQVSLAGRFQRIPGDVETVLDVAHNPDGADVLAASLAALPVPGRTHAVFAVLATKDAAAMAANLGDRVDAWYLAALHNPNTLAAEELKTRLAERLPQAPTACFVDVAAAYRAAKAAARPGDRILVFGSFYTVAEVLPLVL